MIKKYNTLNVFFSAAVGDSNLFRGQFDECTATGWMDKKAEQCDDAVVHNLCLTMLKAKSKTYLSGIVGHQNHVDR